MMMMMLGLVKIYPYPTKISESRMKIATILLTTTWTLVAVTQYGLNGNEKIEKEKAHGDSNIFNNFTLFFVGGVQYFLLLFDFFCTDIKTGRK